MKIRQICIIILLLVTAHTSFTQKLSDTMFNGMSRMEMGDHYMKKSRSTKVKGFILISTGVLAITAAGLILNAHDDYDDNTGEGIPAALLGLGTGAFIASFPVLASSSKHRGRSEMLYRNSDPEKAEQLKKIYGNKARTSSILAWSLLGTGIIVPMVLTARDPFNETTDWITTIAPLAIIASIPFFMDAAKNKGRVSVLTHTERIGNTYLPGSSIHRSFGLGFPIGK